MRIAENNLKTSRFAFVASLKAAKKAFLRNQIRRRLREAVRANLPKIKTGLDVVFFARPGLKTKTSQEIAEITGRLLKKAKLV